MFSCHEAISDWSITSFPLQSLQVRHWPVFKTLIEYGIDRDARIHMVCFPWCCCRKIWKMLNWSNRGQGSCPQCRSPYSSRWKPPNCSKCGYELGGSASAKVTKLSCPLAVSVHVELFSSRTSPRDDRCFVLKEGDFWICLHTECTCMSRATGLRTSLHVHVRTH